jgi:hypothetical protein
MMNPASTIALLSLWRFLFSFWDRGIQSAPRLFSLGLKILRLLPAAAGLSLLKASSATESAFVTLIALDGHNDAT